MRYASQYSAMRSATHTPGHVPSSPALESSLLFSFSIFEVGFGVVFGASVVFGLGVVDGRDVVVVASAGARVVLAGLLSTQHFMLDDGHWTSSSTS